MYVWRHLRLSIVVKEENPVFKNPVWANIKINANQKYFGTVYYPGHGRATEEGRRTGFPLLRYGCQLRASVLEHSSIWRNLKCLLY
jgi:hypothetical protein